MKRFTAIVIGIAFGGGIGYVAGIPLRTIIELFTNGIGGLTESKTIPMATTVVGALIGMFSGIVVSVDEKPKPRRGADKEST